MTLMPGNLLLKPDSAEDRVILLTRGVVSLDIKDRRCASLRAKVIWISGQSCQAQFVGSRHATSPRLATRCYSTALQGEALGRKARLRTPTKNVSIWAL
jgi:hypothetical protein